jgi:hypothetical protein
MAKLKENPSPVRVGYLTLIHEDGSKEVLEVSTVIKLRVKDTKNGGSKVVIEADVEIEYRPAPPLPKYIYELNSRHEGLHLTYGLISGKIERVVPIETSDGRDNWRVCAVNVTVNGRHHRFNDNDPITVTRFI